MDKSKFQEVSGGLDVDRVWPAKDVPLKEGDAIEGRYVSKKENVGPNKSNVYVLEVGDESVGVWGNTVLDTKFGEIAIGKMAGIEYLGQKQSKNGKGYKDFFVGTGIDTVGDEGGQSAPKGDLPWYNGDDYGTNHQGMSVARAEIEVKATDLNREYKTQQAKIGRVEDIVKIAKKQASLKDNEYNIH
jgi:hypothetical protein